MLPPFSVHRSVTGGPLEALTRPGQRDTRLARLRVSNDQVLSQYPWENSYLVHGD